MTTLEYALCWTVGPDKPDNKEFGKFLYELRKQSELSRATVAHRLDLSSEYIRLIERGVRVPAQGRFSRFLDIYGASYQILSDDRWLIGPVCVKFVSRIKEARGEAPHRSDLTSSLNRHRRLGLIMQLLVEADSGTLLDIHKRLHYSRKNPTV